ncbi:hypothetical protein GCM10022377_10180 [Zhihengliuella alba]|uniref:HK97 gp10 family phage protein n=1 Tax=Zhihengliuella alba TaxID=547018 RepID=A0ABP7D464_9MICC
MGIEVDLSELHRFEASLGRIASKALPEVDAVLEKGALNIKNDMVAAVKESAHFKGMTGAISYDSAAAVGHLRYEIGPDKGRRGGALGNIYYFGTSRGGGTGDIDGPLATEEPRTYSELGKLVSKWGDSL